MIGEGWLPVVDDRGNVWQASGSQLNYVSERKAGNCVLRVSCCVICPGTQHVARNTLPLID